MEPYFYCKYGGIGPICSDCKRNHANSPYKTCDITTWLSPNHIKTNGRGCTDYIPIKEHNMVNKQEFIKKACEWLKNNFVNGKEIGCDAGAMHKNFKYIEEIIPSFIKSMEE